MGRGAAVTASLVPMLWARYAILVLLAVAFVMGMR
jgi:hypothetical protein